jgi:predicted NBD/HSP70 family sugar kinase
MNQPSTPSSRDPRRLNRSRVLAAIRFGGCRGRAEIAARTGLTEPAVSRITRELIDACVLREEVPEAVEGRVAGRPQTRLSLVRASANVLAFEIAANSQSVSLIDLAGTVIGTLELNLLDGLTRAATLKRAADGGLRLMRRCGVPPDRVVGAAVSVAGSVDAAAGRVTSAPNIGWHDVPVVEPLAARLGMRVRVESRSSALLLAEHRLGVARGVSDVFLVNVALGLGGAVMFDGRLVRGRLHAAGQIAHLPMPAANGICLCGRIGCLDTVASGRAILAALGRLSARGDASAHGSSDARMLRVTADAARAGDPAAVQAFGDAGRQLGTALRWVAAAIQPELIVLTGVPSRTTPYVDGVRAASDDPDAAPIVVGTIPDPIAAGELALDAFVYANGFDLA